MSLSLATIVFLFGLCVGSFLNVLIYRLPHCLPITGRSFCPNCKKRIPWRDNIPILSFILLKGRCRFCHSLISLQYPLVELSTGLLFMVAYFFSSGSLLVISYWLLVISALIVIFVSDLRYQIIPDKIVYPAIILTILFRGALISGFSVAGFFFLLYLLTRGKGMGLGDVKLAALMGLFLGFPKIIVALYLAFLTGAGIGVILVIIGKRRLNQHIPFGPFLAGATIISLFFGEVIWQKLIGLP